MGSISLHGTIMPFPATPTRRPDHPARLAFVIACFIKCRPPPQSSKSSLLLLMHVDKLLDLNL